MPSLVRKFSMLLLVIAFGVIALAYLASLAPDFRQLGSGAWNTSAPSSEDTGTSAKPNTPPVSADPLGRLPPDLRVELTMQSATTSAEFSREFKRPLSRICQYLDSLHLGHFTAIDNPVATDQWICSSDVIPAAQPAMPNTSSVFVWIRGTNAGEVDLIRLKVNLTDTKTSDAAKSLTTTLIDNLFHWLSWDPPAALSGAINSASNVSLVENGIAYDVKREFSSVPRMNIFIRTNDRSGIMPSDSFAQRNVILPPLSPIGLRGMLRYEVR